MLAVSSLSRSSLYVGGLWIGFWILSHVVAAVIAISVKARWCPIISYVADLERLGAALLGTDAAWRSLLEVFQANTQREPFRTLINPFPWVWSAGILVGLLVLSLWILSFRVRSLDRLK